MMQNTDFKCHAKKSGFHNPVITWLCDMADYFLLGLQNMLYEKTSTSISQGEITSSNDYVKAPVMFIII